MNDDFPHINPMFSLSEHMVDAEPDAVLGPNCLECKKAITFNLVAVLKTIEPTRTVAIDGKLKEVPTALYKLLSPYGPTKKPMPPSEHRKFAIIATSLAVTLFILNEIILPSTLFGYIMASFVFILSIILIVEYLKYKKKYPILICEWENHQIAVRRRYYCRDGAHIFDPVTGEVFLL